MPGFAPVGYVPVVIRAAIAFLAISGALVAAGSGSGAPASLPVGQIEQALNAKGTVSQHVLTVEIDRNDIGNRHIHGVVVKPSFEINGAITFQPLSGGRALLNGDMALRPSEIDRFIDALIANHLVFQAEHQHFYDLTPIVWFIHFRGIDNPVTLAQEMHTVLTTATSVKLPQQPPEKPRTPLDVRQIKSILGADSAQVGSDGVVTFTLTRKNTEHLGGVVLNQNANAETNIAFEPLDASGSQAAVAPDFGMTAGEIQNVIGVMRADGWDIGCLYNQETDEFPQLFFSHDFKVGDPVALARQVRQALNRMNVK